jgi:hypothetical protein
MTLIADFYLETPVLRTALSAVPEMQVSLEQQTLRDSKPFALALGVGRRLRVVRGGACRRPDRP